MAGGFLSGLGKVLNVGAAYLQHASFAEKALGASPPEIASRLVQYTRALSDASFVGFKATLGILIANETDATRRAALRQMIDGADVARRGQVPAMSHRQPQGPESTGEGAGIEQDVALVSGWYDQLDDDGRRRALAAHVRTLSSAGWTRWRASLAHMQTHLAQRVREHEDNEDNAGGRFIEDRIAYRLARLSTGQRDPAFLRQLDAYHRLQAFIEDVLQTSERLWKERQGEEATVPGPQNETDAATVKAGIVELSRTGQYPGGAAQMQKDVMALVQRGEADEVMQLLQDLGAMDGGRQTLNISDHYRPGEGLYQLRWPLGLALPLPFDQLDRPTQFSVLFGEWTRREMEAQYAMSQGDNTGAQAIFEECLARAQQIQVPELVARSHEGLAGVASKTNQRAVERRHLQLAVAARQPS